MSVPAKCQSFTTRRVHRSQVHPAAYNPRFIDRGALAGLRRSLKNFGLVEPLVWNESTGNLVSGHMRLELIDEDQGGTDYFLDVAAVALPLPVEKALNVALNNRQIQGNYDFDALLAVASDPEIDRLTLGWSDRDLANLFPSLSASAFAPGSDPAAAAMEQLAAFKGVDLAAEAAKPTGDIDGVGVAPRGTDSPGPPGPTASPDEVARMKATKKAGREAAKVANDGEFFLVAVFGSQDEVTRFLAAAGLPGDDRYVDGRALAALCQINLDATKVVA